MLALIAFPNISQDAISIGGFTVKWYGLAYVGGLLFASWYMKKLVTNPALWFGQKPTMRLAQVDDMFIWFFLGVVAGGRLVFWRQLVFMRYKIILSGWPKIMCMPNK